MAVTRSVKGFTFSYRYVIFAIFFNNHGIWHSVREVVKVVNFDAWSLTLALGLRVSLAGQQSF